MRSVFLTVSCFSLTVMFFVCRAFFLLSGPLFTHLGQTRTPPNQPLAFKSDALVEAKRLLSKNHVFKTKKRPPKKLEKKTYKKGAPKPSDLTLTQDHKMRPQSTHFPENRSRRPEQPWDLIFGTQNRARTSFLAPRTALGPSPSLH